MLLQQLELRNIRSYETASITFPESSTLLAGDIGCGKSSILLAVEFALFGTSRPDLPGEALLRKGTTKGEVTLTFRLGKKEITINRKLKKEKQGIKQLPGSVIINNVKRELTPVELKAEIISLLGYPIEFISKNKNYIFRYTVYTPQEEMKQILQDHPETRLDVLRKIFNIDKYRQIRENAQLFLKQQRVRLAVSQSKIEPLPERKQQLRDVGMNLEDVGKQLLVAQPLLTKLREQIFRLQQKISSVEEQQQKYVTLQQQTQQLKILIEQKQLQLQQSHQQEEMLTLQIAEFDFPQGDNLDKVQERVHQLEQAHQTWLTQKMEYEKNIQQCQQQLQRITEQLATLDNVEKRLMQEKENITNHTQALTEKNAIEEQEKEVVRQLQHVSEQRAQQEVILQQAKTTKMRILTLNHCPQCLQEVHEQHKSSIVMQEENKISAAQVLVQEYVVNEKKLQVLRDEVQIRLQSLQKKQQQLLVAENEIKQLEKQREQQDALQTEQKELVRKNNQLQQQLAALKQPSPIELEKEKKNLHQFRSKLQLEEQLKEIHKQQEVNELQFQEVQQKRRQIKLVPLVDKREEIQQHKAQLERIQSEEKKQAIVQATHIAQQQQLQLRKKEIQDQVYLLQEEKKRLIRLQELRNWLEEYFVPLVKTIEKQVMLTIHRSCNQLFQEWFSVLMDDEQMLGRIDDAFTPVIEQNGYEIMFSHLSGGERTSAALAYRLALNKVINDLVHDIKTKELLILDEPTDGFSMEQLDKVRDVLEKLSLQQIIIVSHETKIESMVENVLHVEKQGNESVVS